MARRGGRMRTRIGIVIVLMPGLALASGCTAAPEPSPRPTSTPTSTGTPSPTATPTPSGPPSLRPEGTAAENLPLFATVDDSVWNSADSASGRSYIDALTGAGFDRAAMQVTNDETTIGDPAESIQFSVRWNDGQCLVGQVGLATGRPVTAVLPALGDGACLLGATRPIDW